MMVTRILGAVCAGMAAILLAVGWWLAGLGVWSLLPFAAGAAWAVLAARNHHLLDTPAFILLVLCAGYSSTQGTAFGWMLAGILPALAAWDVERFRQRTGRAADSARKVLDRRHLVVLAAALMLGLGLALITQVVQVQLQFVMIVILVGVILWGLVMLAKSLAS